MTGVQTCALPIFSWFQERLWLLNQKNPGDTSYNIPVAFLIEGNLDDPMDETISERKVDERTDG